MYYNAVRAAKIDEPDGRPNYVPLYQNHGKFESWVKRLNIYDLAKDKADFYLDEALVTDFEAYRSKVAVELAKCVEYDKIKLKGQTKNIGSCHDGSKIGKMNEVDSQYVIIDNHLVVKENIHGDFQVMWKDNSASCDFLPRRMRNQFASAYGGVISKLHLPNSLTHAGYRSPEYSGLRYNGPAATSQFLAEGEDTDQRLLTWDMTPTICLGSKDRSCVKVREIIHPILQQNPDKMFGETNVHLIPDSNEGIWKLTTAQLEADLLRELIPSTAPVKIALSCSKALASKLKEWNSRHLTLPKAFECYPEVRRVLCMLNSFRKNPDDHFAESLNQVLKYEHIWIPPKVRKLCNEDEKAYISINTAAMKHILLAAALKEPEAFSAKQNDDLLVVMKLVRLVFTELGDPSKFSSPHAFLEGVRIRHLSVLSSQAENKMALALTVKEQCRLLVLGAMTKVSY